MKKTSTRLATIGGIIVLGACAIVMAQHDSRQREHEVTEPIALAPKPAQPIAINASAPGLNGSYASLSKPIVRANNEGLPEHAAESDDDSDNPLRMPPDALPSSSVVLASAAEELPSSLPSSPAPPSTMPAASASLPTWLGNAPSSTPTAPAQQANAPSSLGTSTSLPTANFPTPPAEEPTVSEPAGEKAGSLPPPVEAPSPVLVPITNTSSAPPTQPEQDSSPTSDARSAADAIPSLPQRSASNYGASSNRMSDTQRGVMQPTDLNTPTRSAPPPALLSGTSNSGLGADGGFPAAPNTSLNTPSYSAGSLSGAPPARVPEGVSDATRNSPTRLPETSGTTGTRLTAQVASLLSDQPGNRHLDGMQSPVLQLEKRSPEEIQVGKKASIIYILRNAGNAIAHDITIVDKLPRGTKFVSAEPAITPTAEGVLTWNLGQLAAGGERSIQLDLIPEIEGELGSVATFHFAAQASTRMLATKPKLELTLESQAEVLIGDFQQVIVNIKNVGTGIARGVRLEADIPEQIRHESGVSQLEAPLGDLHPGQSIRITTLAFTAVQPGTAECAVRAVSGDGVLAEKSIAVDVRSPQLVASIEGPKLRYLERPANYRFTILNNGTAAATNLNFVVHLPAGLKYMSSDVPQANYDPARHTLRVGLESLPAGQPAPFQVTVLPVELGTQAFSVKATADLNLSAEANGQVNVEGLAELEFKISQNDGSIEVGASTTYTVSVVNVGNKPDRNVKLDVELPEGAKLVDVIAQVGYKQSGSVVQFEPISEMAIGDQRTYQFQVQHNQAGTRVVRSQLTSQNLNVGVVKEEGTFVYDDTNN
ncbi:DUF11 domain-containing protein [Aureliella helgolandensis]|uniref:Large cysteine-rich periplasmic protein OmcB n=1 Tax=Aureliella helgolandensis TaxID=2527968 RepID=A0A518G8F1_9BACT|nr:DUF11 domain-containing protein [Aureliella helgolandensis]QDV24865.1 Large cysteine-rich periplasmic protein OmcB [Aureliella helgolandensis]